MPDTLVIKNARLFHSETGLFDNAVDMRIDGGLISHVGHFDHGQEHQGRIIEAEGQYLVPGLWECHAHLADLCIKSQDDQLIALQGFAERGILNVRDVGGPVECLQKLAGLTADNAASGPRIFYAGPMLEKGPLTWSDTNKLFPGFTVAVDSAGQVRNLVSDLVSHGVTHLKTFNKFDRDVYLALIEEARAFGLRVVHDPGGPLFHDIPMDFAIGAGIRCFEHATSPWSIVLKPALQAKHDALKLNSSPEQRKNFGFSLLELGTESVSEKKLTELAQTMVEEDVYFCPTLDVFSRRFDEEEKVSENIMIANKSLFELCKFLVRFMAAQGTKILVGQDGFDPRSTFREMDGLLNAGLTHAQILRGATCYPAAWFGMAHSVGELKPGYEASMLLLTEDPLENLECLQKACLIINKGKIIHENKPK